MQKSPVRLAGGSSNGFAEPWLKDGGPLVLRRLEPVVGIEPTTYGLRNRCSTTELHWQSESGGYRRGQEPGKEYLGDCQNSFKMSPLELRRKCPHPSG